MNIAELVVAIDRNAGSVVFVNVLLEQLGLPLPAVPTFLLAGSLAATPFAFGKVLAAAVLASLVADVVWYVAGRWLGYRVLAGLCYLSINPASCVTQTEARFVRWGLPSLVIAKFIPGFSTVASPIAGALHMPLAGFLLAAGIGALLWAGLAMGAGWLLREEVPYAIALLDRNTEMALLVVILSFAGWIAWKVWQKVRFRRLSALPHITSAELGAALEADKPSLLRDLRGATMIAETAPIPGCRRRAEPARPRSAQLAKRTADRHVVRVPARGNGRPRCTGLFGTGLQSVRPQKGGYEARSKEIQRGDSVRPMTRLPLPTPF
jgi:membrane protein DedA with SNARE-associated domain